MLILKFFSWILDLHKIGGFPVVVRCLQSPHPSLRTKSAGLIGNVCQNCEYCQSHMLEIGVLPTLLQILENDENVQARVKALYAMSCKC